MKSECGGALNFGSDGCVDSNSKLRVFRQRDFSPRKGSISEKTTKTGLKQ